MSDLEENFKNLPFEEKIKIMDNMTEKQKRDAFDQVRYICKDIVESVQAMRGQAKQILHFVQ